MADPGPVLPTHDNARKLAIMSEEILAAAEVVPTLDEAIAGTSLVIGTTRALYDGMTSLTPREAARLASAHSVGGGQVALVFGNEKNGLSNEELRRCHQIVRIPAARPDTSLNLAQALMVIAYEWFQASEEAVQTAGEPLTAIALEAEVSQVATDLAELLREGGFFKDHNRSKKEAMLRRVLSRAILAEDEASVFRGLAHRLAGVTRNLGSPERQE
ncbi:tRNA (cytidine/uridine-2'-O-)-methyltransferase TrmJ [compost metagenome]